MAKFKVVDKAPKELKDNELVIEQPDFVEEINTSKNQPRPINGKHYTTLNHLRSIGGTIGELYDNDPNTGFNPYSSIPFSHYVGIEFENAADLSTKVVVPMFEKHYPQIFFRYLDQKIKTRPKGTELIYFVGDEAKAEAFIANGIDKV